jgi:hypothetical protein
LRRRQPTLNLCHVGCLGCLPYKRGFKLIVQRTEKIKTIKYINVLQRAIEVLQQVIEVLQSVIEVLQLVNEVLQSFNEVLQLVNEVLQSANEVLQLVNEVLQLTFEELRQILLHSVRRVSILEGMVFIGDC